MKNSEVKIKATATVSKRINQLFQTHEILKERDRQDEKWGEQNHDDYTFLAILTEEVGELAQAILHDQFGGKVAGTTKVELVQVAAVALQWLEAMERRKTAVSEEKS